VFACSDGDMAVAVGNDRQFMRFCEVVGSPELAADERFAKNAGRVRNLTALRPMLDARLRQKTRKEWVSALDVAGVPAGPINTIPEVFDDPQVKFRGMVSDSPHPLSGTVPQVGSPMRFGETRGPQARPPPLLGEHNLEVYREMEFSDEKLAALKRLGVI
jgi:crotonobetainyl-CoA:carnitine CoA-transferase CaiB-like acyl-CoA transferase